MANVYKQKRAYYCLGEIYDHGRVFADAGRHLIQSGERCPYRAFPRRR